MDNENTQNHFLDIVADLVLCADGNSNSDNASFSNDFNPERKMVSIFFYNGENMGKMHLVWFRILL